MAEGALGHTWLIASSAWIFCGCSGDWLFWSDAGNRSLDGSVRRIDIIGTYRLGAKQQNARVQGDSRRGESCA